MKHNLSCLMQCLIEITTKGVNGIIISFKAMLSTVTVLISFFSMDNKFILQKLRSA